MTHDAWYDPEVPAGYQDADIEMAEMVAEGNRRYQLQKKGFCQHGYCVGWVPKPVYYVQEFFEQNEMLCFECGAILDAEAFHRGAVIILSKGWCGQNRQHHGS